MSYAITNEITRLANRLAWACAEIESIQRSLDHVCARLDALELKASTSAETKFLRDDSVPSPVRVVFSGSTADPGAVVSAPKKRGRPRKVA